MLLVFCNPERRLLSKRFPLFYGDNLIGRDQATSDIWLDLPGIENQHAKISISLDGEVYIQRLSQAAKVQKGATINPQKLIEISMDRAYELMPEQNFKIARYPCIYQAVEVEEARQQSQESNKQKSGASDSRNS